jgi:hypothetical protein
MKTIVPWNAYRGQVELLHRGLPVVAHAQVLNTPTASSLFHHDTPELSVDINPTLAYKSQDPKSAMQ